jgi:ferredoxin
MLKLSTSRIQELFSIIDGERDLYLPVESAGLVQFDKWAPGVSMRFDDLNTVKSPKNFFFPHVDDVATFKMNGKNIEISDERSAMTSFALFGVRACDVASLEILDKIFLADPVDTFYKTRRENALIITTACFEPEETCFCRAFGLDALEPGGDVATWVIEDEIYWKPLTAKGEELTAKVRGLFEETDDSAVKSRQIVAKEVYDRLPLGDLSLEKFENVDLMNKFDSKVWAKLNPACLSCGTCTFICPTCHCYDIQDFDTGSKVIRYKCWDSCMYSDFTMMAHGNPRTTRLERFRQRYMHKLVYFPDNNDGVYACVGCGRCVQKCPVSMNIVKVIAAFECEGE